VTAFIDTNVLLDVLARRQPFYAAASRIWTLAERGSVRAFVSAISFNNIYYITRKGSREGTGGPGSATPARRVRSGAAGYANIESGDG
jgi:predicted nucleic acid-binding protein